MSEIKYKVVRKLLEQNGFRLGRIKGSHHIFERDDGGKGESVPVHNNRVKRFYYKKFLKKYNEKG